MDKLTYRIGRFDIITLMVAFAVLVSGITYGFFKEPQIATGVLLFAVAFGVTLFVWEKFKPAVVGTFRYKLNTWLKLPGIVGITALASGFLTVSLFVNPLIWIVAAAYALLSGGITLAISKTADASVAPDLTVPPAPAPFSPGAPFASAE